MSSPTAVEWARECVRDIRLTRSFERATDLCDRALPSCSGRGPHFRGSSSTWATSSACRAAGLWLLANWLVEAGPGEHLGRRTGEIVWR
jgi:hypothetical protein